MDHEHDEILYEAHEGTTGAHNAEKALTRNVLHIEMWWPSLFHEAKEYCKRYDVCQKIGKPYGRDELPHVLGIAFEPFKEWAIDLLG